MREKGKVKDIDILNRYSLGGLVQMGYHHFKRAAQ
jgi:hypothetical protein